MRVCKQMQERLQLRRRSGGDRCRDDIFEIATLNQFFSFSKVSASVGNEFDGLVLVVVIGISVQNNSAIFTTSASICTIVSSNSN